MKVARALIVALASFCTALAVAPADANGRGGGHRGSVHGHHGGHHGHWGPFWAGIGLGLGFGLIGSRYYYYDGGWYPTYVVPEPVYGGYYDRLPPPVPAESRRAPDPIFYPRSGQTPEQTEADRQACNRWAMTQPGAMADGSIFHRATLACMEGRDYTVR